MATGTNRKWVFTLNGISGIDGVPDLWDPSKMQHLVYQLERAPTTGMLHLQGAVHFLQPTRMGAAKALLGGESAHVEVCRNYLKAVEYCRKEESRVAGPWEHGKATSQGARTDLASVVAMVLGGKRPRQIAQEEPVLYARFAKNLQALRQELDRPRQRDDIKVALFWGTTGTGKTRTIHDLWNAEDVYRLFDMKTPWMDGYSDQKIVLIDDYGEGKMCIHLLKNILDRYPIEVPVKGGRVAWNPELIVITSNGPPETWYPAARGEDLAALKRRMVSFTFPQESADAKQWLLTHRPMDIPLKATSTQQRPPVLLPASPIQVDSASESEIEEEDNLTDLVAPSWENEPLDLEM